MIKYPKPFTMSLTENIYHFLTTACLFVPLKRRLEKLEVNDSAGYTLINTYYIFEDTCFDIDTVHIYSSV